MAGQPDGSWAQSRQQPQPHEQAQPYEQAPYQSYPPQQQYAAGADDGDYQQAAYQAHYAHQANQAPGPQARQALRSKGFVVSLFDFSFSSFVTPKLIRALYVLATVWTAILTIAFCSFCVHFAGSGGSTVIFLIIAAPIMFLLGLGSIRVGLEVFMVLHRLNENIQAIRDRSDMS
ncbi:MAG TPA: DUF4282 domain-containing protein [Trebonia sp.]|jgi:hypothetical protein|nr:DUF4282 domain-containing protein [Trebonia sp.]